MFKDSYCNRLELFLVRCKIVRTTTSSQLL